MEKEFLNNKEQLKFHFPGVNFEKDYKGDFFYKEYKRLDGEFNVRYDYSYEKLVNFSDTKHLPIHRWFYYQEGYSPLLIKNLINYLKISDPNTLLFDPFMGAGTSLVASKELGIKSIGIEINPFSCFMGLTKTQNYTLHDIELAADFQIPPYKKIKNVFSKYQLSIIRNLFEKETLEKIELLKQEIYKGKNEKVRNVLFASLLCILQQVSFYKKAGNGLKKKRIYKPVDPFAAFAAKLEEITRDLKSSIPTSEPTIINDSCLNMGRYDINNIGISIFSPPYANCFDYYEVYKVELWIGEFVKTYKELSSLRKAALTSNLSAISKLNINNTPSSRILYPIIDYLNSQRLWDRKIPQMLNSYFFEMRQVIKGIYERTKEGGYCVIIVGNSSYGGLAIPTDLILSEIGKAIGFKVKEIIVARKNETSSQQYDKIGNLIEYIRESIVIFTK